MKLRLFMGCLCALMLSACKFDNVQINGGQRIEPSSNIVKREYPMKAFDEIDINVIANVKIIQTSDSSSRVVLRAPDNYLELFLFNVSDHELDVRFVRNNVNIEARHVDITIYTPTLQKIENEGVANIEADRWKGSRLSVDNSGVGSLFLSGLDMGQIEVDCSGVGSVELNGTADEAELECSGVGSIKAAGLKARRVAGEVSGVGGIQCHATEELKAEVSGVGSLKYAGKPERKDIRRSGVGKIEEL